MSLLGSLFSRGPAPRHQPSATTDDAFNAVLVPLRNRVCDFKDVTNMSWTLILPAIQRFSIRLFIQAHGHVFTQKLLASMIHQIEEEHGSNPNVGRNITLYPDLLPEQLPGLAKLNIILRQIADEAIAAGSPVAHAAQGFGRFVALVASRNIDLFGEFYASGLIHASYRELQSGGFDDVRAASSSNAR